jgi:hypothetical protein
MSSSGESITRQWSAPDGVNSGQPKASRIGYNPGKYSTELEMRRNEDRWCDEVSLLSSRTHGAALSKLVTRNLMKVP